jgi:signal transduction histidine kinase
MKSFNQNPKRFIQANIVWQAIKNYFLPTNHEYETQNSDLNLLLVQGRDRILTVMLRLSSLIGTLIILFIMGDLLKRERWDLVLVYLTGMITIGFISHLRQISYMGRAFTFLGILYLLGVADLSFFGIAEDWRLYFSAFSILAALFLGWRAGFVALFISLVTFIILAWQISVGNIIITASAMESPIPSLENIVAFSLAFVVTNAVIISAIITILKEFEKTTVKEQQAVIKLEERTADLENSLIREQQMAREVVFALQREEELNKLRSKIITSVSHEFRTPLTVINNSATMLDKYYDRLSDSKREEQYSRIRQSIFYLTELLQDVSLVESAQNKAVHPQQELIQFGQLCQRLTRELTQETADSPNLEIGVNGAEMALLTVDYFLLKQVVLNLLTNALKFSPPQMPVQLYMAYDTHLEITVTDQGVGIPEAEKDKIWELFYQGSNAGSHSGLGLGLYIVRQLLETMSGTITLTDNPAGGTIFTIQLPVNAPTIKLTS